MSLRRLLIMTLGALAPGFAVTASASGAAAPLPATIAPAFPSAISTAPGPGTFLVARRTLKDPYFGESVVYLFEHDEDGSLGLIVNRASDIDLSEALPDIEDSQAEAHSVYYGGPVGLQRIMMLMRNSSASIGMAFVADDIYISADRRVLDAVLESKKTASDVRFYLGHSGWGSGQLDFELKRGSWHVVKADPDEVFTADTETLWQRMIERLEPEGIQVRNSPVGTDVLPSANLPSFAFSSIR